MAKTYGVVLLLLCLWQMEFFVASQQEKSTTYWLNKAKYNIEAKAKRTLNVKKAKNIIMFLGDGMSHTTIAAARMALGNENKKLSFEEFPYTASSKTFCSDVQVADSACTATQYLNGVKTNVFLIGLNANARLDNCNDSMDAVKRTSSIAKWFQNSGRSSGIVTTTRITHASPAGAYAHIADRRWEANIDILKSGCNDTFVDDIAEQLVHNPEAVKFKVILGGGSRNFVTTSETEHGKKGVRTDGKNLIKEWLAKGPKRSFVRNRAELLKADPKVVNQLFGMFSWDDLPYHLNTVSNKEESIYPSLSEMTQKAIDFLSTDPNGYFLFVEGGRIDHGNHETAARISTDEAIEFSKAIKDAIENVNLEETLIVVTADHGHVLSYSGHAERGNDIFSATGVADDSKEYFTLSYANGPGYFTHRSNNIRLDPKSLTNTLNNFRFPTTVPLMIDTHGGEDVGIWATGPHAHLFNGVMDQFLIPHLMAYISCVGTGVTLCS